METIFLAPSTQSGFRLAFLFNRPGKGERFEDLQAPFFTLFDTGRYARVLGAHVVSTEGRPVIRLALKVQKDQYSLGPAAAAGAQETNIDVERMWKRELENLRRFAGPDSPVGALFEWGMEQPLKPILFCKKKHLFIRPRCPACSRTLSTCREDIPLSRRALTLYGKGLQRYLCCPDCVRREPETAPLYSHWPSANDRSRGVLGPAELYRDGIGAYVRNPSAIPGDEPLRREILEDLCCLACDERAACFGSGAEAKTPAAAERVITPLGFYDFFLLPQEYLSIRYDEHNKLLSGALPDAVRTPVWPAAELPDASTDHPTGPRTAPNGDHREFLFPPGDRRALEIFYLKMTAFQQLCEDLGSFYTACRQPHLQLGPDNVMVALAENGSHLPLAWSFRVKLIDLASGQPFRPAPNIADLLPDICRPIQERDPLYTDPVLRLEFGRQSWMKMTLKELSDAPLEGGEVLCRIRGTLSSDAVDLEEISGKDLLHLTLHQEYLGLMGSELWGRKLGQDDKRCTIECCSLRLSPRDKERLRQIRDREVDVLVSVFPAYHLPCDLYGLGLMLLDSLLANPANERLDIRETHRFVCRLLETYLYNHPEPDEAEIVHHFREVCVTDRASRVLARCNVFFAPQEHVLDASAIPETLWFEALLIGFRLASHLPGFSYCRDHGDFSQDRPEEKLNDLVRDVEALRAKIHTELFAAHRTHALITRVLERVAVEWKQAPSGDTPLPGTATENRAGEASREGKEAGSATAAGHTKETSQRP